jgi:DNA topoisomerase VI subunit A
VPLGTIEVRQYLGEDTSLGPAVELTASDLYPTSGPVNRYKNVLFVEKEGFDPIFRAARLAEKYDLAIMSTKGMSVTAARFLLDRITPDIEKILVLHDFDVSGFTICGTLGSDSRRYTFGNAVEIVDLGLRLEDAKDMGLEAETVDVDSRDARRDTLERHGATEEEIEFLIPEVGQCQRIELNAMTSRQLIDFIEEKLAEEGVEKLVPSSGTLAAHARRLQEQALARKALEGMAEEIARKASAIELPDDLENLVQELLNEDPKLSWDEALAQLIL